MPKRIAPLTDTKAKNTKPGEKDAKLYDGGGLYLLITPAGGKLWCLKYRYAGKEKKLSFGSYPEITLAEARERRDSARKLLANGIDPGEAKKTEKAAKAAAAANTFEVIAREWHEHSKPNWSTKHAERLLKRLEQDVFPVLGDKPVTDIKTPDLVIILKQVATRTLETAHRIKTAFYHIFQYTKLSGKIEINPAADLRKVLPTVKYTHMAAPTDPKQVAPLMRAIDDFQGSFIVKCALQLAPILFVRPGELRKAEWSEIDLDAATWNIPGEKMKMKMAHLVPLSKQAADIFREIQPLTGRGKYVFPCHRSFARPMSENAINAALRRLGFDKSEITGHGFRAMARTMLHEILHFTPDAIEAQLAHAVPDRLGNAYNRTTYLEERKKMMQDWADYLDGLKSEAKVLFIK